MVYIKAILLGIVEGFTEFLPISSTGHLVLVEDFLSLDQGQAFTNTFHVAIQLPAIAAVVVYFWSRLWPFSGPREAQRQRLLLWTKIIIAVLPAVVLGLLFDDLIEAHLLAPVPVAIALLVGGIILIAIERRHSTPRLMTTEALPYLTALWIGCFQCLAMIPGTSRSASTIIGAMLLGATRPVAAEFSFFLAIPTMLGATMLTLAKHSGGFTPQQWALLAIGGIVSFVTAYAVIAAFMGYIRKHDFQVFGYYRIVLGAIVLLAWLFRG